MTQKSERHKIQKPSDDLRSSPDASAESSDAECVNDKVCKLFHNCTSVNFKMFRVSV